MVSNVYETEISVAAVERFNCNKQVNYANLQLFLFGSQLSDFTLKFSLHVIVLLGHFLQYLVKLCDGLSWSKKNLKSVTAYSANTVCCSTSIIMITGKLKIMLSPEFQVNLKMVKPFIDVELK